MCGIAGYITTRDGTQSQAIGGFTELLSASSVRGKDASGVAFIENAYKKKTLFLLKSPIPSFELVESKNYKEMFKNVAPKIVIGHARAETKGTATNNNNNHPITTRTHIALVHNGMITNDDALFEEHNMPREAQVDSEIIARLIEKYSKELPMIEAIQKTTKELSGSFTVALITKKEPDALYLFRHTNPLSVHYEKATGTIYFSSTQTIFEDAFTQEKEVWGFFREKTIPKDQFISYEIKDDWGIRMTSDSFNWFQIEAGRYSVKRTASQGYMSILNETTATKDELFRRINMINKYERENNMTDSEKRERDRLIAELGIRGVKYKTIQRLLKGGDINYGRN